MNSKWVSIVFFFILLIIFVQGLDDSWPKADSRKLSSSKLKLSSTELHGKTFRTTEPTEVYRTEPLSELGVTVPPEDANYTLQEDFHMYYNSTFYSDKTEAAAFWVDLDSMPQNRVVTHQMLSDSHRQATTIEMSFDFPFYGAPIRNVTIATGGFLYTGDYLHNWIAATQYVAPLMANFDTGASPESTIKYADNGTAFTVQWTKVSLQDKIHDGAFTFQVTLLKNGDIVFAYKDVPYPVANISDARHPVKIGISDAYILERNIFFIRRKTIYEYHRIDMIKRVISNNTAIYFVALPTCAGRTDCLSCLALDPKLQCNWCNNLGICSNGMDRQRQDWLTQRCHQQVEASCAAEARDLFANKSLDGSVTDTTSIPTTLGSTDASPMSKPVPEGAPIHFIQVIESNVSSGAIVTIVIFLAALVSVGIWVFYAFRNPETPSGQFLIKYRPSQWTFKKEDASINSSTRHL